MKRIWILNDLYVDTPFRKKGTAKALIETVINYSLETGIAKIILSTAHDNYTAQALYETYRFLCVKIFMNMNTTLRKRNRKIKRESTEIIYMLNQINKTRTISIIAKTLPILPVDDYFAP